MDIRFRNALFEDYAATREIVAAAFRPEEIGVFLDAIRADDCVLGEWLAEDSSGPVGHIAFSRVHVEHESAARVAAAILAPLAVRPDRQCRGVGARLTALALSALEGRGETLFFVLGHPEYYPRFGFSSAAAAAVASPWSGKPAFMARGAIVPKGRLVLPRSIADYR